MLLSRRCDSCEGHECARLTQFWLLFGPCLGEASQAALPPPDGRTKEQPDRARGEKAMLLSRRQGLAALWSLPPSSFPSPHP